MKRLIFAEELKKGNFIPVAGMEGPEDQYSVSYNKRKITTEPVPMPVPVMSELKDDLWVSLVEG